MITSRPPSLPLLSLLLLAVALPAAAQGNLPRAGEVSLGIGFGLGSRLGPEVMLRVMASDDLGLACKASAFTHARSWTCGAELYPFGGDDAYYLVAEVGKASASGPRRAGVGEPLLDRVVFVNLGFGWEVRGDPEQEDDYVKQIRGYTAAGLSLSLFAGGELDGRRAPYRPFVRPNYFWDLVGITVTPNARR